LNEEAGKMVTGGNGRMKIVLRLATATFMILFLMMSFAVIVTFYPFEPVVFTSMTLDKEKVSPRGVITYTTKFIKHTDKDGEASRFLMNAENSAFYPLGPITLADSPQGPGEKVVANEIYDYVIPGRYRIKLVVKYDYFGIRTVRVKAETPCFTVTK
jgi:hypothetical protein